MANFRTTEPQIPPIVHPGENRRACAGEIDSHPPVASQIGSKSGRIG